MFFLFVHFYLCDQQVSRIIAVVEFNFFTSSLGDTMRRLPLLFLLVSVGSAHASPGWHSITIATYNMAHGVGPDNVYNLYRTASLIQSSGADVVLLQDVDVMYYDGRSGCEDQPKRLGELIGYLYPYQRFADRFGGTWFLGACGMFQPYAYGILVLSKVPINAYEIKYLPQGDGPEPVVAQAFTANVGGMNVTFANTHFTHKQGETNTHAWARTQQALAFVPFVNSARQKNGTTFLFAGGDFNAAQSSPELASLYASWYRPSPPFPPENIDLIWSTAGGNFSSLPSIGNGSSDHAMHLARFWYYSYF